MRETQYLGLEPKILIEERLSPDKSLEDYKFFCSYGQVFACQVDIDRFTHHKRAIVSIPDFEIYPVISGEYPIPAEVAKPARLPEMIKIASELSKPFDFVRVDLYEIKGEIYFGEFTFSPGAGVDQISNEALSIKLAQAVLKRSRGA